MKSIVAALIVAIGLVTSALIVSTSRNQSLGELHLHARPQAKVQPSCSIAITNSDTEFVATGDAASDFCLSSMSRISNAYKSTAYPSAPVACQYEFMAAGTSRFAGGTAAVTLYDDPESYTTISGEDACSWLRDKSPNNPSARGKCALGSPTMNVYVVVSGRTAFDDCHTIVDLSQSYSTVSITGNSLPNGDVMMCSKADPSGNRATVYDQPYGEVGTDACKSLDQNQLPNMNDD